MTRAAGMRCALDVAALDDPVLHVPLAVAVGALARTSEVPLPVKLVLARGLEAACLRCEGIAGLSAPELRYLDDGFCSYRLRPHVYSCGPGTARKPREPLVFADALAVELADALAAAEWIVPPRPAGTDLASTPLRAAPRSPR